MAKRFTDTNKWGKASFSELSSKMKLAWIYLCDKCDHAGIWDVNMRLMSFEVGFNVTVQELAEAFGDKVQFVGETKLFIPSFFEFQYSTSKDGFRAKQSALQRLQVLGLVNESGEFKSPEVSMDTQGQSPDCLSISIGISKSIKKGGVGENKTHSADLERIYRDIYPLKKGKTKGLEKLAKQVKEGKATIQEIETAATKYRDSFETGGSDPKFIQHFSTWAGEWRDWLDPVTGTSDVKPIDWMAEATIYLQGISKFPPGDSGLRDWLGPERTELLQQIGGPKTLREMRKDDFTVKRVADQIQAAYRAMNQKAGA